MKSVLAIAALAATSAAKVHKAKLEKVPLATQLEGASISQHALALGQKYMGARPLPSSAPLDELRDTSIHFDDTSPVPIENFLNAQCEFLSR